MVRLNLFDLFAKISLDTSEYDSGVKDVTKSGSGLASKLKSGLASAGKVAASGIGLITAAAGAAVGGLMALEESTEEYRIAQGKLQTAFDAAGMSADAAQKAYNGFYEILGDTDTATEASQLLAKLAENEEDVSKWTKIAAGVNGTFGDSLPIEGLIEASNETAKVGQVTGVLADALNWAGINEDEFNEKLAACTSESERNQLIMETLSGTYSDAASAFYKNNKELVASRDAQTTMIRTMSKLADTVQKVKNGLVADFLPAISDTVDAFNDVINGVEGSDKALSDAISNLVTVAVQKLPEFLSFGVNILTSILSGIIQSIPALVAQIPTVVMSIIDAFSQMLPQLAESGGQMLSMLADGLRNGIPRMLEALPDVIMSFLDYITENLPAILEMGVELVTSLAQGIIDGIPKFIEKLPELITSFVDFITENLPRIIESGVQIAINLATGIIQAIPEIVKRLPEIIAAIARGIVNLSASIIEIGGSIVWYMVQGIKNLFQSFIDIGKNIIGWIEDGIVNLTETVAGWGKKIVDWLVSGIGGMWDTLVGIGKNIVGGIWEGIKSAWSAFTGWVMSGVDSIVSGVKGALGIHSPSKVFRDEVGYMIGLGIAEGIDSSKDEVTKAANDLAESVYDRSVDWLDKQVKYNDYSLREQLEVWREIQSQFIKESKQYAEAEEQILDIREQILKENEDLEAEYLNSLNNRTQEILGSFGLFDAVQEREMRSGQELIGNMQGQVSTIEGFFNGLDTLAERGVSFDLIEGIREAGPTAIADLYSLLSMTDDELKQFNDLYEKRQYLAREQATKELEPLRQQTTEEIRKNMNAIKGVYEEETPELGKAFTDGLAKSIESGMSSVVSSAVNVAKAAVSAAKNALGLGEGWNREIGSIQKSITNGMDFGTASVDFASSGLGISSAGIINSMVSGAKQGNSQYTFNLVLPDGTALASYVFNPLVDYSKANGTPILNPT